MDFCGTSIARSFLGDDDDFMEHGFMEHNEDFVGADGVGGAH